MGREFASAAARWFHLPQMSLRPEIVAICRRNISPENINWFKDNIPTIKPVTIASSWIIVMLKQFTSRSRTICIGSFTVRLLKPASTLWQKNHSA